MASMNKGVTMREVTVPKDKLLGTMKLNRDQHRAVFLKAQKKYRAAVISALDDRLQQAREGGVINLGFALPAPQDFTAEYDAAIAQIEWDMGDTVTLSEEDFNQFVLNQWSWARAFAASTELYVKK
jgi:hypothetical protein